MNEEPSQHTWSFENSAFSKLITKHRLKPETAKAIIDDILESYIIRNPLTVAEINAIMCNTDRSIQENAKDLSSQMWLSIASVMLRQEIHEGTDQYVELIGLREEMKSVKREIAYLKEGDRSISDAYQQGRQEGITLSRSAQEFDLKKKSEILKSGVKKLLEDKIQGIKSTMTDAEFQALKETGIIWEVKSKPKENL